jgi:hypothetical protein
MGNICKKVKTKIKKQKINLALCIQDYSFNKFTSPIIILTF